MTSIGNIFGQGQYNASYGRTVSQQWPPYPRESGGQTRKELETDGYGSVGGSILRNTAVGAAAGAALALPTGIGLPIGIGIGAAVGAGSALIRTPLGSAAVGDAMKGGLSGAAAGSVVGMVTPLTPVGGAVVGAVTGGVMGIANTVLKNVAGGKFSIDAATSVGGRTGRGALVGAASGAAIGAAAGALFGGIGAVPGAIGGALIGALSGAFHGFTTGAVDKVTKAKGMDTPKRGPVQQIPGQYPSYQNYQNYPMQYGYSQSGGLDDVVATLPGGMSYRGYSSSGCYN